MRPTASPSRPYGRYAIGLRPSLDPDAYFGAPNQDQDSRHENQDTTDVGLDRPRSFRNDWGQVVAGSNPVSPTTVSPTTFRQLKCYLYL